MSNHRMFNAITELAGNDSRLVLIGGIISDAIPPAAQYMSPNTQQYYELASMQYTIPFANGSYEGILNDSGRALYDAIDRQYRAGAFKSILAEYFIEMENSGFWAPDKTSAFYDVSSTITSLNTFQNMRLVGVVDSNSPIKTSVIIFMTSEWAYTLSGSIYGLGVKLPYGSNFGQTKSQLKNIPLP